MACKYILLFHCLYTTGLPAASMMHCNFVEFRYSLELSTPAFVAMCTTWQRDNSPMYVLECLQKNYCVSSFFSKSHCIIFYKGYSTRNPIFFLYFKRKVRSTWIKTCMLEFANFMIHSFFQVVRLCLRTLFIDCLLVDELLCFFCANTK